MSEIKITPHIGKNFDGTESATGMFDITFEGSKAIGLTYDEMLGLISCIAMPQTKPCLQWLKTPEQIKEWDEKYNK